MRLAILIISILGIPSICFSAILHVPSEYRNIQNAIDNAQNGDIVMVADGVYTGPGNKEIRFHGKEIVVQSANGPENCVIDCEEAGRAFLFDAGEGPNSILQGFTITNGFEDDGGGICCMNVSSPAIENCNIISNRADNFGGGIYCENGSNPTLTDCEISHNIARYRGGALYHENLTSIHTNQLMIINCLITHNVTTHEYWGPGISDPAGAGLYFLWSDYAEIRDTIISYNIAKGAGGGIYNGAGDDALFENCIISNNQCEEGGGGVFLNGSTCNTTFDHCLLTDNEADYVGGLRILWSGADILNSTISNNISATSLPYGVNFHEGEPSLIMNSIIWGNTPTSGGCEVGVTYTILTVLFSDIGGGFTGLGNIDADPLFANVDEGIFALLPESPCIDAGNPSSPPDPDGTVVDMGALPVQIWTEMGYGLAGSMGIPTLEGSGTIAPGEEATLILQNGLPNTPAYLGIGFKLSLAPFHGGVIVPFPYFIIALVTDPSGSIEISKTSMYSAPPLYFQYWLVDPVTPYGLSASNGLAGYFPN